MEISNRIMSILPETGDSWAILGRVRAMQAAGLSPINLTVGDHDWTTPDPIIDAMERSARGGNTGYSSIFGSPELRDAVAERVSVITGHSMTRDNIAVTPGGQAALFVSFCATLDPGDAAIVIEPYYATYPETVRAAAGQTRLVQAMPDDGFQPRADALAQAAKGARALLVNSPNNPTGAVYSPQTIDGICKVCLDHDLWLVTDEVYAGQVHEGHHVSPVSYPGMAERTLHVGSFSKSHVMTGFRIGWVAGPPEVIYRIGDLMVATTYGVPGFIQDAALWCLRHGDAIEAETGRVYARRRIKAMEALRGAEHVHAGAPGGAMYLMLDIRATGLSGQDFANRLLDEEQVAVMPGESFGLAAAGHVRVALTIHDDALVDAIQRLVRFADARVRGARV